MHLLPPLSHTHTCMHAHTHTILGYSASFLTYIANHFFSWLLIMSHLHNTSLPAIFLFTSFHFLSLSLSSFILTPIPSLILLFYSSTSPSLSFYFSISPSLSRTFCSSPPPFFFYSSVSNFIPTPLPLSLFIPPPLLLLFLHLPLSPFIPPPMPLFFYSSIFDFIPPLPLSLFYSSTSPFSHSFYSPSSPSIILFLRLPLSLLLFLRHPSLSLLIPLSSFTASLSFI